MVWSSVTAYFTFTEIFQHFLQFDQEKSFRIDVCPGAGLSQCSVVHWISLSGGLIALISVFWKKAHIYKDLIFFFFNKYETNVKATSNSQGLFRGIWSSQLISMDHSFWGPATPATSPVFVCKAESGFTVYDTVIKRTLAIHCCIQCYFYTCHCCPSCAVAGLALQSLKRVCMGGNTATTCYRCSIREACLKTNAFYKLEQASHFFSCGSRMKQR